MNRISLAVLLLLTALVFVRCKKDSDDGGISFTFVPKQSVQYTSLSVSLSNTMYGNPIAQAGTTNIANKVTITGIKPGNYFWSAMISYSSSQQTGNYSFNGQIIIEKGKIMNITLED